CECVRRLRIRRQPVSRLFPYTTLFRSVRDEASERSLRVIDATCPLVTKVHAEAKRFAKAGYTIFLIGHDGHEEVEGTTGEAPEADRKSTRLNSSHVAISYAVFCLNKKI